MSVRLDGDRIKLEGDCRVEEAESLVALLTLQRDRVVDLAACRSLHSAVLQVLIAYGATVEGVPEDSFLRKMVLPAIVAAKRVHSI